MDLRNMGFDTSIIATLQDMLEYEEVVPEKSHHTPTRAYVRDAKAMASTPADVKEYPNSYVYEIDMPGIKPNEIKVQVEDNNVLVVSGERRREKEKEHKEGVKFVKMERRMGKFMRKFVLSENANTEAISAVYQDGVLIVTVQKVPPPEPKKPKTIEVKLGGPEVKVGATEGQEGQDQ